jgi:hypothetical protein
MLLSEACLTRMAAACPEVDDEPIMLAHHSGDQAHTGNLPASVAGSGPADARRKKRHLLQEVASSWWLAERTTCMPTITTPTRWHNEVRVGKRSATI